MRISISELHKAAANKPNDYLETVYSKGVVSGDYLVIDVQSYNQLLKQYGSSNKPIRQQCCSAKPSNLPVYSVSKHSNKQSMPSLFTQMRNVAQAVNRTIQAAATNKQILADEQTVNERKDICSKCEFWVAEKARCSICGCKTNAKVRLQNEHCPKQKW